MTTIGQKISNQKNSSNNTNNSNQRNTTTPTKQSNSNNDNVVVNDIDQFHDLMNLDQI